MADDQPEHVTPRGAERHADADFAPALRNRIAQHPVDADAEQQPAHQRTAILEAMVACVDEALATPFEASVERAFTTPAGAAMVFEGDFVAGVIGGKIGGSLLGLYTCAVTVPGWAVTVRRLHDTNRSGWWMLIGLVPFIGAIVLLVFLAQESHAIENEYGPIPQVAAA